MATENKLKKSHSTSNVLVITYSFPPNTDIGARRWYKITKFLARNHCHVFVLTIGNADQPLQKTKEGVTVKVIKGNYPKIMNTVPRNFFHKLYYHMVSALLRLRVKGTIYDKGVLMKEKITVEALKIIREHKIKNVVATGAPFSFFRYALALKKEIPELNVICDLRDPWTDGIYYGFSGLSPARLQKEKQYEREVMDEADVILTPNERMTGRLKKDYGQSASPEKFKVLWHPYDPDEIGEVKEAPNNVDTLKILTGGTIDLNEIEKTFEPFLKSLDVLQQQNEDLYRKTNVEIYGSTYKLRPLLNTYSHLPVTFKEKTTATEFFNRAKEADFLLVFLPPYIKDFMITKITEYMALKRPILLYSAQGMVAEYIVSNKLGIWIDTENIDAIKDFPALVQSYRGSQSLFNHRFDTAQFGGPQVAAQLMSYFM